MRKEVEASANLQVARLERAMVGQRRWTAADFRQLFLHHPLMRHLAARIAWGVFEGDALRAGFRLAEDWTLADAADAHYELPEDALVGIPHVLEMPPELRAGLTQVFGDYEIAQPFKQLARETYALDSDELPLHKLARFAGKSVATAGILALNHKAWARLDVQDYQVVSYGRELAGGVQAELRFTPGITFGDTRSEPVQKLDQLLLRELDPQGKGRPALFSRLTPLQASEVLRDVELLTPARA
jgi:hypothetical protein